MKKLLTFAVLGLAALSASAERADLGKQTVLEFDTARDDRVAQTTVLNGNVVVTKGTLVLRAEKAVFKQTPEEDMMVTLNAGAGKPATFRQKRDGGPDLWIEGEAQRIEYDERNAMVKLFGGAIIRELNGTRLTNEVQGASISYDNLRELFLIHNDPSGASKPGGGRSKIILAPRKPRTAPAPATTPPVPVDAP